MIFLRILYNIKNICLFLTLLIHFTHYYTQNQFPNSLSSSELYLKIAEAKEKDNLEELVPLYLKLASQLKLDYVISKIDPKFGEMFDG